MWDMNRYRRPARDGLQAAGGAAAALLLVLLAILAWNRAFVQPRDLMIECAAANRSTAAAMQCQQEVYQNWPLARYLAAGAQAQ